MKWINLVLLSLLLASPVFAASSVTQAQRSLQSDRGLYRITEVDWIADTDGSFTDVRLTGICGLILHVSTDPGSPAPTADYDITLLDPDNVDIMGNALADRSAGNSEQSLPYIGGSYGPRYVCGDIMLTISNNSVNSAEGKIIIYEAD